jgi:hypothetical protein
MAVSIDVSVVSAMAAMGGSVGDVADRQFRGQVLAVRGAATVAKQHQFIAAADGSGAYADKPGKRFRQFLPGGVQGGFVLVKFGVVKGV